MADIQKILDPLAVPKEVKAQAWDAFHQSGDSADFQKRFDPILLPKEVKATLWEMKYVTPIPSPEEAAKLAGGTGAMNRFWGGAAREMGAPESMIGESAPPLTPGAESTMARFRAVMSGTPVSSAVGSMLEPTVRNIVGQAASGNVAGAVGAGAADIATWGIPQAISRLGRKAVVQWLKSAAERQYGKVLSSAKELPKAIAESKVIPGAIDRGVTAFTFGGLKSKVAAGVEKASAELDEAWNALPPDSKLSQRPIWSAMNDVIRGSYIKGTNVLERPQVAREAQKIQKKILAMVDQSTKISTESARHWRQLMDKDVFQAKGFYLKGKKLSAQIEVKKVATNAQRAELAKAHPDIATVNAEFSFWKNFEEILDATSTRRVGQEGPLGRKILVAGGAAAGLVKGPGTAVLDAAVMALAESTFRSPAWRTVGAVAKDRLAKALAGGNAGAITLALKAIGQGTINQ